MIIRQVSEHKQKRHLVDLIGLVCLFVLVFLPRSHNGVLYDVDHTIIVWALTVAVVVITGLLNHTKFANLVVILSFTLIYMIIVTLLAQNRYNEYHVSLARIAPLIVLIYLSQIKFRTFPTKKWMLFLLHSFCTIAIVWNSCIMLEIPFVLDFTYNNFSQYATNTVFYSIIVYNKPVMSFGVHTYAAYFYLLFFFMSYYAFEQEKKSIYLFYCIFLIFFTLFLLSTTAVIYFSVEVGFLLWKLRRKFGRKGFIIAGFILMTVIAVIISNYTQIYNRLYVNFTGGQNSFVSRYSSNSVFNNNFDIISSSLGIGFNIVHDLEVGYSDSGYIVYLTMGNLPLTIIIYSCLYAFLKMNIPPKYRTVMTIAVFSFEFALPATFHYRFIYIAIFMVFYFNSLSVAPPPKA